MLLKQVKYKKSNVELYFKKSTGSMDIAECLFYLTVCKKSCNTGKSCPVKTLGTSDGKIRLSELYNPDNSNKNPVTDLVDFIELVNNS